MALSVRRLGPGDEPILDFLAANDADFDLEGRGEPLRPLDADAARRYLENPAVLHWIVTDGDTLAGFLYCLHVPLRAGDGSELLLYEIASRQGYRRRGIGRALVAAMDAWMQANDVPEVWVLADNRVAVDFYRACGFATDDAQPVYMTRRRAENDR